MIDKVIMAAPKVILVLLVILGLVVTLFSPWGLLVLLLAPVFMLMCFRKIPYRPPYVGLVVIWGRRLLIVKKEGWHLFAPIFPFLYGVTLIKVEKVNLDFTFTGIRTKALEEETEIRKRKKAKVEGKEEEEKPRAGGELSVNILLTYFPDYKSENSGERLIAYINSGSADGVKNIIRDLIEEDIREMGHDFSWEQLTFSAGDITERLVEKLAGKKLTADVKRELHTNGLPDVVDLGIRISRFNVGKVKEQGELAKAAESFAKEEQQRRGEEIEQRFVQKHTKKYIGMGVSPGEAVDAVQVERGKAKKEVRSYRGFDKIAEAVGTGIGSIFVKKK